MKKLFDKMKDPALNAVVEEKLIKLLTPIANAGLAIIFLIWFAFTVYCVGMFLWYIRGVIMACALIWAFVHGCVFVLGTICGVFEEMG